MRRLRAQHGHQERTLRPLSGLPGISRVHVYQAPRHRDAGPLPQVRRAHDEARRREQEDEQAVHLLRLRIFHQQRPGEEVRLHDLGRADEGRLPRVRADDVQKGGQGLQAPVLHQPRVRALRARGSARLREKETRRDRRGCRSR